MTAIAPVPKLQFFDANGNPLVGGKLYTYAAGTTTPLATYTDNGGGTTNANPVILDSRGEASVWLGTLPYKFKLTTSTDVDVWTVDNLNGPDDVTLAALINSSDAAKGDALVAVKRIATGAVATTVHAWIEATDGFNVVGEFAALKDGTDQTSAVQLAVTACGARSGGTVVIPRGCKFNVKNLTFPQRCNLEFWMDDDLSRPNPYTILGSNEMVLFQANANADGIVNEHRITAPFHPGFGIDLRRDVPGQDAHLGPGQVRIPDASTPARASYNIWDQQVDCWRMVYEIYGGDYSNFTGVKQYTWRRVITLTGIGTGNYSAAPAVGQMLTGTVSGARGWFLSSTSTTTSLLWLDGKFAAGDSVTGTGITAATTASSVAFTLTGMPGLAQDLRRGFWSVGLPPGSTRDQFAVGGRIGAVRTRTAGQYIEEAVLDPGFTWADSYEGSPINGFHVIYDTSVAAASRRLYKRKYGETLNRQVVGSLSASLTFGNSLTVAAAAHNISSVTKPSGAGVYRVTFFNSMASSDYQVQIGASSFSDRFQRVTTKTPTYIDITNYNSSGSIADLAGSIDVSVFLGDI